MLKRKLAQQNSPYDTKLCGCVIPLTYDFCVYVCFYLRGGGTVTSSGAQNLLPALCLVIAPISAQAIMLCLG